MKPTDWIFLLLTFVTGVFIGMSIYVVSFKPTYAPDDIDNDEDSALEFSVIGKAYGGMLGPEYIRPSFRVLGDGSYTYIAGGNSEDALEPIIGKLSRSLLRELKTVADTDVLIEASQPFEKESCRLFVDGIDYQYQVTYAGTVYRLDTCGTNLPYNSELALTLEAVWNELENGPQSGSSGAGLDLQGLLDERLDLPD